MKINSIELYNFGSYEGEARFNTLVTNTRNIILVGGKNGAGKTTLFTAMRVCLYGYISMGYKSQNSYYKRAITKLINNNAKMTRPTDAYVQMEIQLSNGRGMDIYRLRRSWVLSDSLTEFYSVEKNNETLSADEVADFEKYILSLITPELFNLYFFDGEKIADFFLNEGSNERIKEAFLTLCGYDTFDIMRRNFKRVKGNGQKTSAVLDEYLSAKDAADAARHSLQEVTNRLNVCIDEIGTCEADIAILEKEYTQKGGITEEEWNRKLAILKDEEKKRDNWNGLLRKWANDLIPFLMIRDQVQRLKRQIERENNNLKYRNFCEVLDAPDVTRLIEADITSIKQQAFILFGNEAEQILNLSFEQSALLLAQVTQILDFDTDRVKKCKQAIKNSITKSGRTRKELETSNVATVQEYMRQRAELFEKKSLLLTERVDLEQKAAAQTEVVKQCDAQLTQTQAKLVEDLKKASVSDISARAIVMLDKLQGVLYKRQIEKVEGFFRSEIRKLMRKTHFIDDICIDDNFNTHIYRTEAFDPAKLVESIMAAPEDQVLEVIGEASMRELQRLAHTDKISGIITYCKAQRTNPIMLPVEIDKTSLSNGEKQIFIMALYHSLVQLCNYEIPFVIDTPFARIDTEHRRNISLHFFCELKGQVFILSTNEEIDSDHIAIIRDHIATTYMLENSGSQKTEVLTGSYFEV